MIFAMHTVRIEQFGGKIMKESSEGGIWITGVKLEPGLLEVLRVKLEGGVYVEEKSDYIIHNVLHLPCLLMRYFSYLLLQNHMQGCKA